MNLIQRRVQQAAKDGRVSQPVVEPDYAQSYVLLGIAGQPELRETLVFKGGTALKKVYFKSYRFSEDLDFSAVDGPRQDALEQAVRAAVRCGASGRSSPRADQHDRGALRGAQPASGRPGGISESAAA